MTHVFVKKLVDEWVKMGHKCVVISPLSMFHVAAGKEFLAPKYEQQKVGQDAMVDVYRPRYYMIPKIKFLGVSLNGYFQQRCIEKKIAQVGVKFDAIYCHFFAMATEGWHYATKNRIPLFVATGESSITVLGKPCFSFTTEKMSNDLCGVVAVSSKNKEEAVRMGYAKEENAKVFPNGANLQLFFKMDKLQCRDHLGLPPDKFIIICVGQFVERKGQKRLLAALDKLNDASIKTVFIGKGEDQFEHESILFKGVVKNTELPYYLNAADAFVLPTRSEGCCNAIIEALACGLPVISSDRPFNYDVLNSQNSILIDPDNIDELADGIRKLVYNPNLCKDLADQSYMIGKKLSIVQRAENILTFMQDKIKERTQK